MAPAGASSAAPEHRSIVSGIFDPLLTVAPVPGIDGVGSITQVGGDYSCTSATNLTGILTCPPVPLDLLNPSDTVLEAVPGAGWEFGGWDGCPGEAAEVCTIGSGLVTTLVEPIATFTPVPESEAPETVITSQPDATTTDVDATLAFEARNVPADAAVSFECKIDGLSHAPDYKSCVSPLTYSGLEPGSYTFAVHAIVDGVKDESDATATWRITDEAPDGDASAPQTSITEHPRIRKGGWLLQSFAGFKFTANTKGATFRCGLDGHLKVCDGQVVYRTVASSTHTFSVAASAGDQVDRSPAKMTFTVPKNNTRLRHSKAGKSWAKKQGSGYFLTTYSETSNKGAWVKKSARSIKKIALVATQGKGHGTVKVFLGKKLLKKVSLQAKRTRKSQLIPIKTFRSKKRGAVRVVVVSRNKTVRIEGLGIATR